MVAEISAQSTWTYEQCAEYAQAHSLSTRSVISKVKSLELTYVPKTQPAANPKAARPLKAEVVLGIAKALNVSVESIEGLSKADMRSLTALSKAVQQDAFTL
jgi:hypothetical protein